jgi:hypothetical protein
MSSQLPAAAKATIEMMKAKVEGIMDKLPDDGASEDEFKAWGLDFCGKMVRCIDRRRRLFNDSDIFSRKNSKRLLRGTTSMSSKILILQNGIDRAGRHSPDFESQSGYPGVGTS